MKHHITINYSIGSTAYLIKNSKVEIVTITGFKVQPAPFNNYSLEPVYSGDSRTTSYSFLLDSELQETRELCVLRGIEQLINT